jgi:hypothetical protein
MKNDSGEPIVVARSLVCVANGPAHLCLDFQDEKGLEHSGEHIHSTMSALAEGDWWAVLAPSHFYGVDDTLSDLPYEFLKKPGRYKVTAKYISKGGFIPASREDWQIPRRDAWVGEVNSNVASFEVVAQQQ